jgi:hypothetical protein
MFEGVTGLTTKYTEFLEEYKQFANDIVQIK